MSSEVATLAPGLLIAPPSLTDPNFDRSVVLLAEHAANGALGFVINRLLPIPLGELLARSGFGDELRRHARPVFVGGPVMLESAWILWREREPWDTGRGVLVIGENLRAVSSREAVEAFARDLATLRADQPDPLGRIFVVGYSGWGPGQLDGEISRGSWVPAPLDEEIVLDLDVDSKWERAYAKLGLVPGGANMRSRGEA